MEARIQKLEKLNGYSLKAKDVYIVSSNNLNNEHNIYGYIFYEDESPTHVIIGNNSITKDGCYMRGLVSFNFIDLFSDEDVDIVIGRIRTRYNYVIENLKMMHVMSHDELKSDSYNFICLKILVINLFLTYVNGETNKIFSNKVISELINGIIIRPLDPIAGQKITSKNRIEKLLLRKLTKSNLPFYPKLIDATSFKYVSKKCVDSYLIKDKIKDFYVFTMEDCGKVLSKYINHGLLIGDIFNDLECAKSLVFSIIIAILELNKMGFIHGDLHLNNITVRETSAWKEKINYASEYCYCEYELNGKFYYCKFNGAFPTIIDFGRSKSSDNSDASKNKIKTELGINTNNSLEIMQCLNMIDFLRFLKGIYIIAKTTETNSNDCVKDFLQNCINVISNKKPNPNLSLYKHAVELIELIADQDSKKNICMRFKIDLDETMLALRANEDRLS